MRENEISKEIVKAIYKIHNEFGPGLLESVYEELLYTLLKEKGFKVERQVPVLIMYKGRNLGSGYRADLIVEDLVIVEIKSVEDLHPVHFKQLLTYLRLADIHLGILVNFNEAEAKDGIRRIVNNL